MSGEQAGTLPEDLERWLRTRAAAAEVEPQEVLVRAVRAYRLVEEEGETLAEVEATHRELAEEVRRLASRLATVEGDVTEKIDDVRGRVVQVKREADEKAPRDHRHPELVERVDAAGSAAMDAREDLDELGERVERGFENYEDVLTYLRDTTDEHDEKTTRLARAVIDLRGRTAAVETAMTEREAADSLKREANQQGITAAKCGECQSTVQLGLLSEPRCPHCDRTFEGVEPARGFFGSPTLAVGEHPALEGATTSESEPVLGDLLNDGQNTTDADDE